MSAEKLNEKIETSSNAENVTEVLEEYGLLDKLSDEAILDLKYRKADSIRDMLDILIEGDMLDSVYTKPSILHLSASQAKTRINFALANNIKLTSLDLGLSSKDFEEKFGISDRDLYANHSVTYGMEYVTENDYYDMANGGLEESTPSEYEAANRLIEGHLGKYRQGECTLKIGDDAYSLPKAKRNLARIIANMSSKDLANLDGESAEAIIAATLLANRSIKPKQPEDLSCQLFGARQHNSEDITI